MRGSATDPRTPPSLFARRTKKARRAPYEEGARTPSILALVAIAASLIGGCGDDPKSTQDAGATAASAPATATAKPAPTPTAKASAQPADGVELLKFQLTTGVKNKDPVDKLDAAKPGQRVYGHLTVRNRTAGPERVSLSFRVNDDERAMVDLTVEKSWSWRTWAYVTLRKDDKGELTVHAFDAHGAEIGKETIPIK